MTNKLLLENEPFYTTLHPLIDEAVVVINWDGDRIAGDLGVFQSSNGNQGWMVTEPPPEQPSLFDEGDDWLSYGHIIFAPDLIQFVDRRIFPDGREEVIINLLRD